MQQRTLRKALEEYVIEDKLNFEEYQDKYFLKKKIQEIIPEATDEQIYNAIEKVNQALEPVKRKKDFINLLLSQLPIK